MCLLQTPDSPDSRDRESKLEQRADNALNRHDWCFGDIDKVTTHDLELLGGDQPLKVVPCEIVEDRRVSFVRAKNEDRAVVGGVAVEASGLGRHLRKHGGFGKIIDA